jgi:hypothetical protein
MIKVAQHHPIRGYRYGYHVLRDVQPQVGFAAIYKHFSTLDLYYSQAESWHVH